MPKETAKKKALNVSKKMRDDLEDDEDADETSEQPEEEEEEEEEESDSDGTGAGPDGADDDTETEEVGSEFTVEQLRKYKPDLQDLQGS
jgi:hypothetical protein